MILSFFPSFLFFPCFSPSLFFSLLFLLLIDILTLLNHSRAYLTNCLLTFMSITIITYFLSSPTSPGSIIVPHLLSVFGMLPSRGQSAFLQQLTDNVAAILTAAAAGPLANLRIQSMVINKCMFLVCYFSTVY